MATLLEPFAYGYMVNAIWVSALVGALCAFLSAFVMLKGWSLIGDALSHAIVPGVAGAWILGLPFTLGAVFAAALASAAMLWLGTVTRLRQDAVIGVVFTGFFALGLFMMSLRPASVNLQTIMLGNVLAITPGDTLQLVVTGGVALLVLAVRWRDLVAVFFDEAHARTIGLRPDRLKVLFFALLALAVVAALQTVGAFLVVAMIITPGATAYLLTDRFGRLIVIAVAIGAGCSALGAYLSYFLDGATGGLIIVLMATLFLAAFLFAPKHGLVAARSRAKAAGDG
jgi:manganese/iron transport system permease protein